MRKIIVLCLLMLGIISSSKSFSAVYIFPAVSTHGMVASEQKLASKIGADILKSGGNAIDAAVAMGYALAVVNPCCGNIGGGGFMTVHLANGQNIFINFREKAPLAATPNMYLNAAGQVETQKSLQGYLAVAVPGTVMGLNTALSKYGTLTLKQVMQPAIKLAADGFVLTEGDVKLLNQFSPNFKSSPNVAAIFLFHGQPYHVGNKLIQKNLAQTLQLIANNGTDAFYKGAIAKTVVDASKAHGGILSMDDFAKYTVEELKPVRCSYRSLTIISSAPPSSGGTTLCEMLNILEGYPLGSLGFHTAASTHYIVEAMRHSFYDRNLNLGDPDFVTNPVAELTSKAYAAKIRGLITDKASPSNAVTNELTHEGTQTTHYSVLDQFGNAVSVTYSLNAFFGADVIAGNTGFLLNDSMDDFSVKPGEPNRFGLVQGAKNKIAPGKRPLSSMTPTIVLQGTNPILIVGSPGGPRIITSTLLTILNIVDYGMNVQRAVDAPRFHQQWLPEAIDMEPDAFSPDTLKALTNMGYTFTTVPEWGAVEAVFHNPADKTIYGASDRRRLAGEADGY